MVRDVDVPLDGVLWLVVERRTFVRESNGVVVVKLLGVVAAATELWNVLLEGVFGVPGEVVLDDDVVGGRLCRTVASKAA